MSWMREDDLQADTPRNETLDPQSQARSRGLAMAQLQSLGWSLREIASFFGTNHMAVKRAIGRIPREARRRLGSPQRVA